MMLKDIKVLCGKRGYYLYARFMMGFGRRDRWGSMGRGILILGGSSEALALADALSPPEGPGTILSLAGRTSHPRLPQGAEVRIGGFGGVEGLERFLAERAIWAVVDATHAFAANMGSNAALACAKAGVPLLRLERPAWQKSPGDRWDEVDDWSEAVTLIERQQAKRVLLTIGRQELEAFTSLRAVRFVIRSVDAPDPMPDFLQAELVLARGPFSAEDEETMLRDKGIDLIVCKNSGGAAARGKLTAAARLKIPVVMRRRPSRFPVSRATRVAEAALWVRMVLG